MIIKGLQKTTLLDYPGKVACTIFFFGCNFRCPFCHNKELILEKESQKIKTYTEREILEFLEKRKGKLEAICLTGGEPTLNENLPEFIKRIKALGYLIKLDTNGVNPEMVENLIKDQLIDYVALDYKGPMEDYKKYINKSNKTNNLIRQVKRTIEILLKNKVSFELRTTVVPTLHNKEDLLEMVKDLKELLTTSYLLRVTWYLQQFRPKNCLEPKFDKIKPYDKQWFEEILKEIKNYLPNTKLRGI